MGQGADIEVVAGVLVENNRVLLAQRGPDDSLANLWEFPGGKVENGETYEEALIREFWEELALRVAVGPFICREQVVQGAQTLNLYNYLIRRIDGEPQNRVHQTWAWVEVARLCDYAMPEADQRVVEWLQTNVKSI